MKTKTMPKALVQSIARRILRIKTLEERRSDSLDFPSLHVVTVREALEAAYAAGRAAGAPKGQSAGELMAKLVNRQRMEGFSHGYLGHSVRCSDMGTRLDRAALLFLKARGFDTEDAFQALNSKNGRHLGDDLTMSKNWDQTFERNLWKSPAAMYAYFGTEKQARGEALRFRAVP